MLGKVEAVFPRADKSMIERMQQMEQQRSEASFRQAQGRLLRQKKAKRVGHPAKRRIWRRNRSQPLAGLRRASRRQL